MGKSFVILHGTAHEAIAVGDRELVHRLAPLLSRSAPIGGDVAQRQPIELGGGIVAGDVPLGLSGYGLAAQAASRMV